MAGASKAGIEKSIEACVQMMIVASERQERNFRAQTMFLESMRLQRERDATEKKDNKRKLRCLKNLMSGEVGKGIDLTDSDSN